MYFVRRQLATGPKVPLGRAYRQRLPTARPIATETWATLPAPFGPQPRSRERPRSVTPRRSAFGFPRNVDVGGLRSRQPPPDVGCLGVDWSALRQDPSVWRAMYAAASFLSDWSAVL